MAAFNEFKAFQCLLNYKLDIFYKLLSIFRLLLYYIILKMHTWTFNLLVDRAAKLNKSFLPNLEQAKKTAAANN